MKLAVVEMIALAVLVAFTTFVDSEEVRFVCIFSIKISVNHEE